MLMKKRGEFSVKLASFFVTGVVITLLIIAGPANAFSVGLSILNDEVKYSENVNFAASIEIEAEERLPVSEIRLNIIGATNKTCVFSAAGKKIEGCEGVEIVRIDEGIEYDYGYRQGEYNNESYDFGYGYGYDSMNGIGKLSYNITLDSSYLLPGNYSAVVNVKMNGNEFLSEQVEFSVLGEMFKIKLNKKWNLISVPAVLMNNDVESVFEGVESDLLSVWSYDPIEGWKVYKPGKDTNNLEKIEMGRGYWVEMKRDNEINVVGYLYNVPDSIPKSIELVKGWNLIGYYGTDGLSEYAGPVGWGKNASCALYSLRNLAGSMFSTKWSALLTYWENDNPEQWKEMALKSNMDPGAGYWIHMDEEGRYARQSVC